MTEPLSSELQLKSTCAGPGAWTLRIGRHFWSANYIPELRAWTAYDMDDSDLTLGPKQTLAEIKDTLKATLCTCGHAP